MLALDRELLDLENRDDYEKMKNDPGSRCHAAEKELVALEKRHGVCEFDCDRAIDGKTFRASDLQFD